MARTKNRPYSLYAVPEAQPKVLRKHDLVNIMVQEVSQFQSSGTTDLKKSEDLDAKVDQWIKLKLATLSRAWNGTGAESGGNKARGHARFQGGCHVDRSDTVTTRLEAEVIDVKPNGTLVLQAKKHIKIG